jgi:hypothetical protein
MQYEGLSSDTHDFLLTTARRRFELDLEDDALAVLPDRYDGTFSSLKRSVNPETVRQIQGFDAHELTGLDVAHRFLPAT